MKKAQLSRDPFSAIRERLDTALLEALRNLTPGGVKVHAARKQLKRARASVRLLREAVGDESYRRLNTALRDAAHPLSQARDAEVLLATLRSLAADGKAAHLRLSPLLRVLRAERRGHLSAAQKRTASSIRRIESARRAAGRLHAHKTGWAPIAAALQRTYRRARREWTAAKRNPTAECLHEWRKQVKYLWHQLEALQAWLPRKLRSTGKDLHELVDLLGDDHDLYVLGTRLARSRDQLDDETCHFTQRLIDDKRAKLQKKAFKASRRLFRETPKEFGERLACNDQAGSRFRAS